MSFAPASDTVKWGGLTKVDSGVHLSRKLPSATNIAVADVTPCESGGSQFESGQRMG
jgi:hypothetical protein